VRLEDFPGICAELRRHAPIRCGVVCCAGTAGRPNISWCDTHEPETIQINVVGQLNVAEACRQHLGPDGQPTHCTLVGTGCIYAYDAAGGHPRGGGPETAFTEAHPANFLANAYARLRVALEQLLAPFPNVLLLRVT
jgi:3,5-epimerase/4-reductase